MLKTKKEDDNLLLIQMNDLEQRNITLQDSLEKLKTQLVGQVQHNTELQNSLDTLQNEYNVLVKNAFYNLGELQNERNI